MGEVVISVDAELAWGYHDLDIVPDRLVDSREAWQATLRLFSKHDVPATWGIVGHLMLEDCDGVHENHPLGSSWFPCRTGSGEDDANRTGASDEDDANRTGASGDDWWAPNLVEAVRAAEQNHEIASHTFSHVVMNGVDRDVADAELAEAVAAAERSGDELESLIFPRNGVAHRDVLAERGFSCYRGIRPDRWYDDTPFRPLLKLADWSPIGTEPPLVTPTIDEHGLVNVPASLYLFSLEGPVRRVAGRVGHRPVVSVAKRGIDEAVDGDGVFHMWFHPHNLLQPDGEERLDAILAYLDRRREETDLTVRTMGDVAADVRASHVG